MTGRAVNPNTPPPLPSSARQRLALQAVWVVWVLIVMYVGGVWYALRFLDIMDVQRDPHWAESMGEATHRSVQANLVIFVLVPAILASRPVVKAAVTGRQVLVRLLLGIKLLAGPWVVFSAFLLLLGPSWSVREHPSILVLRAFDTVAIVAFPLTCAALTVTGYLAIRAGYSCAMVRSAKPSAREVVCGVLFALACAFLVRGTLFVARYLQNPWEIRGR